MRRSPINANLYHYGGNNPVTYVDPTGRESGYTEDHEGAMGFGHAALFTQLKDGRYALFELIGLSIDTNGIPENANFGDVYTDKWGTKTLVLSNSENSFPSKQQSEKMGKPGNSGVLLRIFGEREEMLDVLKDMGFEEAVCFSTSKKEDAIIFTAALTSGINFRNYNIFFNSCGIYANNALTTPGSNLHSIGNNAIVFPFSFAIPNIIGGNLLLANPSATVENIKKRK